MTAMCRCLRAIQACCCKGIMWTDRRSDGGSESGEDTDNEVLSDSTTQRSTCRDVHRHRGTKTSTRKKLPWRKNSNQIPLTSSSTEPLEQIPTVFNPQERRMSGNNNSGRNSLSNGEGSDEERTHCYWPPLGHPMPSHPHYSDFTAHMPQPASKPVSPASISPNNSSEDEKAPPYISVANVHPQIGGGGVAAGSCGPSTYADGSPEALEESIFANVEIGTGRISNVSPVNSDDFCKLKDFDKIGKPMPYAQPIRSPKKKSKLQRQADRITSKISSRFLPQEPPVASTSRPDTRGAILLGRCAINNPSDLIKREKSFNLPVSKRKNEGKFISSKSVPSPSITSTTLSCSSSQQSPPASPSHYYSSVPTITSARTQSLSPSSSGNDDNRNTSPYSRSPPPPYSSLGDAFSAEKSISPTQKPTCSSSSNSSSRNRAALLSLDLQSTSTEKEEVAPALPPKGTKALAPKRPSKNISAPALPPKGVTPQAPPLPPSIKKQPQ